MERAFCTQAAQASARGPHGTGASFPLGPLILCSTLAVAGGAVPAPRPALVPSTPGSGLRAGPSGHQTARLARLTSAQNQPWKLAHLRVTEQPTTGAIRANLRVSFASVRRAAGDVLPEQTRALAAAEGARGGRPGRGLSFRPRGPVRHLPVSRLKLPRPSSFGCSRWR